MFIHRIWYKLLNASICIAGVVVIFLLPLSVIAHTSQNVENVQQKIKEHQEKINKNKENLRELELQLKEDEREISIINNQLKKSKADLANAQHRLAQLRTEQNRLLEKKEQQLEMLSKQLTDAYKLGSSDYVKLVFNQEDPNLIGRALEYHIYINKSRTELIENITTLIAQVERNRTQIEGNNQELKMIIEARDNESELLKVRKRQKEETYSAINENIKKEEKKVEILKVKLQKEVEINQKKIALENRKKEEERIAQAKAQATEHGKSANDAAKQTIEQIEKERLKGLKNQKGSLLWPVTGRIVKKYGDSRAGELKWTGLLLQSRQKDKNDVISIADGDVVMASPLDGYGLIIVLDHGDGYLSIYGNNNSVTRKVGDRVKKGDIIGYYDQTNQSLESSLYFEIRYKGSPINPQKWLRKN